MEPQSAQAPDRVAPRRRRRWPLVALAALFALLAATVAVMVFGLPWRAAPAVSTAAATAAEAADDPYANPPAPDPLSPLASSIPGCVCHSDDPKAVDAHKGFRMNQCFGCHQDGMPEMGGQ